MAVPHYREQIKPRISANQLAAYLVSTSPLARDRIIRDARFQSTIPIIHYKEAREAISKFLVHPAREWKIIAAAKADLQKKVADTTIKAKRRDMFQRAFDALGEFENSYNQLGIGGVKFVPASRGQPPLTISGVQVSVNLDVLIEGQTAKGDPLAGGAILKISKGDGSDTDAAKAKRKEMGLYGATLVHMAVTKNFASRGEPSWRHCFLIDVQKRGIYPTPKTYLQRAQEIERACTEIAAGWKNAEPPPTPKKAA